MCQIAYIIGVMHGEESQLREFLLDAGLVSRSQMEQALGRAQGTSLSRALIESGVLSEDEVRRASAHALGIPYVSLSREDIELEALTLIPEPVSRAHSIVAYRRSERGVEVALLDMADLPALDFLKQKHKVLLRLTSRDSQKRALLLYQKHLKEKYGVALEGAHGPAALDALLLHATSQGASVVHIEPLPAQAGRESGDFRVRYRVHGSLHEAMALSKKAGESIMRRIKEFAETKLTVALGDQTIKLRIETTPVVGGEKLALYLTREPGQYGFTLESLGLHGEALEHFDTALRRKTGLIVVVGPQKSGVTTTLYTVLDMLSHPSLSLASVEETIGHRLPHVAQTEVQSAWGLSAAAALRAQLRQDPDVVMIDDVKDEGVLLLAGQAAKRSLVLVGTDESVPTPSALLTVRQRLVRKLCKNYREEHRLSRAESAAFEGTANFGRVLASLKEEQVVPKNISWKDVPFYRAEACGQCKGGLHGVVGVFEVLDSSGELVGLSLAEDALFKAAQGITSIEEVLRVTADGSSNNS